MRGKLVLNADGTITNTKTRDLQALVDSSKAERDAAPLKGQRYRNGFTKIANVDEIIVEKILAEHGCNFFHKEELPRFMAILRTEYPNLMTVPGDPMGVGKIKIYSRPN